ncbi:MAG: hypothetical protein NZ849_06470 [Meiothermus sp.]|uniref:hypothetical protein n=1 Tax=Meiothermus sp. TaxID=1955249 RepID=UPI0025ECB2C1|nr:hypothetical protein [Meiothermus sp.]MCS7194543.1 hypothetical protein [Meiothermus sp.]
MRFLIPIAVALALAPSTAQEVPGFGPVCPAPEICLEPALRLQLGLAQGYAPPWAAGGLLALRALEGSAYYRVRLGVWFEGALQWGLLEAYGTSQLGPLELSYGKRGELGGPWSETFVGQDGRWGVWVRYQGLEAAYLPHPALVGGQLYVGARSGEFQAGAFAEVAQGSLGLTPRLSWRGALGEAFWQADQGFWGRLTLPLGEGPSGGAGLEGWVWWNPEWTYLGPGSFLQEGLRAWLLRPRKLVFGLAYTWEGWRFGAEASRAPVEAAWVYLRLHLP